MMGEIICVAISAGKERTHTAGRQPRVITTQATNPTKQEIEKHEVTYIPCRVWGSHCICRMAASSPHRKGAREAVGEEAERQPIISTYCRFLVDTDEHGNPTNANETLVLVIWDDKTKA